MTIVQKDGFNFMDGLNNPYIVIDSARTREYVQYMNENNISAVALTNSLYRSSDIDFLSECPAVHTINITSSYVMDLSGLSYLNRLNVLSLNEPKTPVDLSRFSELSTLHVDLNKNVWGLEECANLRVLKLWKYKPASRDLIGLANLTKLVELELTQSAVTSLQGSEVFTRLQKAGMYYCSKLECIQPLTEGAGPISKLSFESCKKIKDYEKLSALQGLEELLITEGGEIPSIEFIRHLALLRSFVFMGTTVADRNLHPCTGLQYVAFTQKKHYTHRMKDFKMKDFQVERRGSFESNGI